MGSPLISQTRINLNSGWVAEFYLIGYSMNGGQNKKPNCRVGNGFIVATRN